MSRAMGTAVDLVLGLDAVADNPAFAMGASGGHGFDSALEAVERHRSVALGDAERLVIVITAHIALSHGTLLSKHKLHRTTTGSRLGSAPTQRQTRPQPADWSLIGAKADVDRAPAARQLLTDAVEKWVERAGEQ